MFGWQAGNTTRFIKFEDIDRVTTVYGGSNFYLECGDTTQIVPYNEYVRFVDEFDEWSVLK